MTLKWRSKRGNTIVDCVADIMEAEVYDIWMKNRIQPPAPRPKGYVDRFAKNSPYGDYGLPGSPQNPGTPLHRSPVEDSGTLPQYAGQLDHETMPGVGRTSLTAPGVGAHSPPVHMTNGTTNGTTNGHDSSARSWKKEEYLVDEILNTYLVDDILEGRDPGETIVAGDASGSQTEREEEAATPMATVL